MVIPERAARLMRRYGKKTVDEHKPELTERHPAIKHVLGFFSYAHLSPDLQVISRDFHDLALRTADRAPDSPETTVALRKLLEAKDAAVRAVLPLP